MMRSLFSGVSGIKVHQTRMDVIGNNIANINTVGFKSSRTTFSDMFSQLQKAASAPTDRQGGINPRQIGLGVNVESIDLMFADASPQQTGKNTDLALMGNGLFVLRNGDQSYYTRNGAFMFDEQGYYVLPGSGLRVQGWNATSSGVIDTNALTTDIVVPVGKTMEANETTEINYSGNLNKESNIIEKISYTESNRAGADASRVVTTSTIYTTPIAITADGFGDVSAKITGSQEYASGGTVESITASTPRQGREALQEDGTSFNPPQYYYTVDYLDSTGRVIGTATSTASYTTDNAPTEVTPTATASEDSTGETNTQSVNVDGQNVLAAKITFKDGTTMNVTSGYYQVGKSVPITTLATVYDSLGGKHEVTVLIDKDDTSEDANLTDPNAIMTATILDESGNKVNATNISAERNEDGSLVYSYNKINADGTIDPEVLTADSDHVAYYNRWRVYIAPGVGEQGPASEDFTNSYERSQAKNNPEADGSKTVGTMNTINYIYFDDRGQYISNGQDNDGSITFEYSDGNGAASNKAVLSYAGMTQYANSTTSFPTSNGNAAGVLQSLAIDASGIITGTYTNGLSRAEAQIAVAQFQNAAGLTKSGTTIYQESNNSGQANIKTIDDFGMTVTASALEMSNVDLATEFSDMIITQRGFQANSKITTVSDEMLETLVNMKR